MLVDLMVINTEFDKEDGSLTLRNCVIWCLNWFSNRISCLSELNSDGEKKLIFKKCDVCKLIISMINKYKIIVYVP